MNPYDPQRPSPPESFAGRARLIAQTQEYLERGRVQQFSAAVLVHGHRGSGKTSALRKIESLTEAAKGDTLAVEIPLHQTSSDADLLRSIVQELHSAVRRRKEDRGRWRTALERLQSVNVSVLGTGVGVERSATDTSSNPLTLWRECLEALEGMATIAICIDDAERLNAAGVGTLKTIAESRSPVPVLLAVAAGPEMVRRLATHEFSPVARAFSGATFDMEAFSLTETREALEAALRPSHATGTWSDGAVRRIHDLSHGYPYLVKCLAHAAYRDETRLTEHDVERAVPLALETAAPWLERELSTASDGDIRAFVRIARSERDSLRSSEIIELGINSVYIGRLVKLGVLKKVAPGHYELHKAPVIAYYHELKRRLGGDGRAPRSRGLGTDAGAGS